MPHPCEDSHAAIVAAEVLKALAHPLRLRIVALLCDKTMHVNAIAERLGASQSTVSQQLRILRMRNLVGTRRENSHTYYRIIERHLHDMVLCMDSCLIDRGASEP